MEHIKRIECGHVNCYMVYNDNAAVLIDTAEPPYGDMLVKECEQYPVKLILITHAHKDHTGNAALLAERLGVPIAMGKADANLLTDPQCQPMSAYNMIGENMLTHIKQNAGKDTTQPFAPSVFVQDNDTLEQYGINAKIIALPGHTDGSVGLDTGDAVIVGDALFNIGTPTLPVIYHNKDAMKKSAEKISALGQRTVYFGHGVPVENREWE
ncbi:MAG: MBL fold metallo-hydrolase [Eubacterium sp.]|nr:MBL fold metallo-hydrolase [Eubacterium sp.]